MVANNTYPRIKSSNRAHRFLSDLILSISLRDPQPLLFNVDTHHIYTASNNVLKGILPHFVLLQPYSKMEQFILPSKFLHRTPHNDRSQKKKKRFSEMFPRSLKKYDREIVCQ